jgi:hypothetical protein
MTTGTSSQSRTYGGWQAEKVPFIFGLSGRRAAMLAAAVLSFILPVTEGHISAAAVFWPLAAILAVIAFARVAGRTTDEWAVAATSHLTGKFLGRNKFASGPFAPPLSPDDAAEGAPVRLDLPGILAPVRMLSVPAAHGRDLAVMMHDLDATMTAIARLRCPGIGLVDSGRRDQRVAGWGTLLAGLCKEGSPVTRLQALERLVPETGAALRGWHDAHAVPGAPDLSAQVAAELLNASSLVTTTREAYLAVTMDTRRARGQIRAAGGGESGAATVLVRHLQSLAQSVAGAGLQIDDWLGTRDLAEVIRTAYDPRAQEPLAARRAEAARAAGAGIGWTVPAPGAEPHTAGPVYAEADAGWYAHDGARSVTYWVEDWPHSEVFSTVLGPLLGDGKHRRTFSLVFEPLAPRRAEREIMRERTARHVAVRMRQRTGQIIPEHERAASARALNQDAERAAGNGMLRFVAYLTVTVTDPADLADACAALEADARQAGLEPRRMWCAQDTGFAVGALPLGMGLPQRRW